MFSALYPAYYITLLSLCQVICVWKNSQNRDSQTNIHVHLFRSAAAISAIAIYFSKESHKFEKGLLTIA